MGNQNTPAIQQLGGKVGIGTGAPSNAKVHIVGDFSYVGDYGYSTLRLEDGGYPGLNYRNGNTNWLWRLNGGDNGFDIVASTNASGPGVGSYSRILKIQSDGNVGIGKDSPIAKLDVNGGAVISGSVTIDNGTSRGIYIDTTVADNNTRDAIYLFENDSQASGRQAISWYNGNQSYYKARLWTEVGSSYLATQFGIDVADDARTVATRLIIRNGNVGIGASLPSQKLEVGGNIKLTSGGYIYGDGTNSDILVSNASGTVLRYGSVYVKALAASIKLIATSEEISLQNNNGSIWLAANGNVSVGKDTPNSKLDVYGNAIISGSLNATSYLTNGTSSYQTKMYTFNLSAQSTNSFFPIRFTNVPHGAGQIHTFEVLMDSFTGGDPYNHHSVLGTARGSGWTDLPSFFDVFHNAYDSNERSYLGLFRGTQSCTDLILYVRGGKAYYVKTPSDASVSTSALTIADSVFAIKDSSGNDVSGTSAYISFMLNLITAPFGRQVSHAISTNDWFYANTSGTGIYNTANAMHFSANGVGNWNISSNQTWAGLRLYSGGHVNTWRGHFYGDSTGQGFLNSSGNWQFLVKSDGNVGIGTTTPIFKFQTGGSNSLGGPFVVSGGSDSPSYYDQNTGAYYHTPGAMVRKDSSTTTAATAEATLVLYNKNGNNNTNTKLVFANNETAASNANPIATAAIVSEKVSGTAGGWGSGNLKFLVKNGSDYVDCVTIKSTGNVGINTTDPYGDLEVKSRSRGWGEGIIVNPVADATNNYGAIFFRKYNYEGSTSTGTWAFGKNASGATGGEVLQIVMNGLTGGALYRVDALQQWKTNGDAIFGFNVGIGKTDPVGKLDISGDVRVTGSLLTDRDIYVNGLVKVGKGKDSVSDNTVVGAYALNSSATVTGNFNTAVGKAALQELTSGNYNTSVGWASMGGVVTGPFNVAVGIQSLGSVSSGGRNIGIGSTSGFEIDGGSYNTIVGYNSGRGITSGGSNTIIGAQVTGLSSGLSNTVIIADGSGAIRQYIDSSGNMAIGKTGPINAKLDVNGSGSISGSFNVDPGTYYGKHFFYTSNTYYPIYRQYKWGGSGNLYYAGGLEADGDSFGNGQFKFGVGTSGVAPGTETMVYPLIINGAGSVGIGKSSSPFNSKFDVSGNTIISGSLTITGILSGKQQDVPDTAGSGQWVKLGTLTIPQQGYTARIRAYIHAGFNANNNQDYCLDLFFKTSNAVSVDSNGFSGNSWYYTTGYTTSNPTPKWVGNAAGTSATAYDLYLSLPSYTNKSHYVVEIVDGASWKHIGATGQVDPGNGSSTVCVSSLGLNIPIGNVGIGTVTPNAKLDVNGGIGLASNYNLFWGAATNDQTVGANTPAIVATTGAGFYIVPNGSTTGTTLRIAADGNVGIGIGSSTPNSKLHVNGNASISGSLVTTNNVGIGVPNPIVSLNIGHNTSTPAIKIGNSNYGNSYNSVWGLQGGAQSIMIFGNNGQNEIRAGNTGAGGYLDFYTNNTADYTSATDGNFVMRMTSGGNIGIGTTTAYAKLDIQGATTNLGDAHRLITLISTNGYGATVGPGISFGGEYNTGASVYNFANIQGFKENATAGNTAGALRLSTTPNGGNPTERVRIKSDGNVGIGTTTPNAKFEVNGGILANGDIRNSWGEWSMNVAQYQNNYDTSPSYYGGMSFSTPTRTLYISNKNNDGAVTDPNGAIVFRTGATPSDRVWITYGGNVGIGTNVPYDKLEVAGAVAATGATTGTAAQGSSTILSWESTYGAVTSVDWGSEFKPFAIRAKTIDFQIGVGSVSSKVYINGDGNLGIGSTTPYAKLDVQGATVNYGDAHRLVTLISTNGYGATVGPGISFGGEYNSGASIYNFANIQGFKENATAGDYAGALRFSTCANSSSPTEKVRIKSDGNVGIGTSTPGTKLEVNGSAKIVTSLSVGNTAPSGTAGEIRATDNVTAYYSDERLKTKLGPIENPIEKVKSLSGFYFSPNDTAMALGYAKKIDVGVSAQQVNAILPEIIAPAPIDPQYMTVRYEKLIPLLIEAIKEQQTEIDTLKSELSAIKKHLNL